MTIDAKTVKVLREKTGAGMMDCKRALVETEEKLELQRQKKKDLVLRKTALYILISIMGED